jgi:hypothetical protein
MAFEAILEEVDQLNAAGDRIEGLAVHHLPVSGALISIAGNVRHSRSTHDGEWLCQTPDVGARSPSEGRLEKPSLTVRSLSGRIQDL